MKVSTDHAGAESIVVPPYGVDDSQSAWGNPLSGDLLLNLDTLRETPQPHRIGRHVLPPKRYCDFFVVERSPFANRCDSQRGQLVIRVRRWETSHRRRLLLCLRIFADALQLF